MQVIEQDLQVEHDWKQYSKDIRTNMDTADITNFTNWRVIRYTMFSLLSKGWIIDHLSKVSGWESKWKEAVIESPVGNPKPCEEYPQSSYNLLFQAWTLSHFLAVTECDLEGIDTIFEFGGGYGCMCRLIHRLGFSGKYTSFDLPPLLELQEYYLSRTVEGRISYLSDAEEFTEQLVGEQGKSIFMACWSISEAPVSLRDEILNAVCNNTDYIFISFQTQHGGFDNMAIFKEFVDRATNYEWVFRRVPNVVTSTSDSYYLFGRPR